VNFSATLREVVQKSGSGMILPYLPVFILQYALATYNLTLKGDPEAEEVFLGCAMSAQDDAVGARFTACLGHRAPVD
jgi:hypothetical protein